MLIDYCNYCPLRFEQSSGNVFKLVFVEMLNKDLNGL